MIQSLFQSMKAATMGTVKHLARCLEHDLAVLLPALYKSPREKLATMAACLIETRSCNTLELAARLPIETDRVESRYAWIERFLSAETIDDMGVMAAMTRRLLATLSAQGQTLIVSIDQTSLDAGGAIAMMSARVGERALPLFWSVKNRQGNSRLKTICRYSGGSNLPCRKARASCFWRIGSLARRS